MQEAFDYLLEKELIFKSIVAQYGLPVIPQRPQGFETIVLLILEQQVSIDSAKATFNKLKAPNSFFSVLPTASVFNPLGTVFFGSNPAVPEEKRLRLEIIYTKPN